LLSTPDLGRSTALVRQLADSLSWRRLIMNAPKAAIAAPEYVPTSIVPLGCEVLMAFLLLGGILISTGFFFSVASPTTTEPNHAVYLIYLGAASLAVSVITLGIGLLRAT
jgi:hypothetical protein